MDPYRILAIVRAFFNRKSAPKQNSSLLKLPLDVIYEIFDRLEWPAKVLLSQTCKVFWYTFHQKGTLLFRTATPGRRRVYRNDLANILMDRYSCSQCKALHLIDLNDTPSSTCVVHLGHLYRDRSCSLLEPPRKCKNVHDPPCYCVAFRHVQFAMKHSRSRDVNQRYVASIMQGFGSINARSPFAIVAFNAEPRIVNGRFLMQLRFIIYNPSRRLSYWDVLQPDATFCPHHSIGRAHNPNDPILEPLQRMFIVPDDKRYHRIRYSCDRCASDFQIVFKDNMLTVFVWHDLGDGVTSDDPYWKSHVWSDTNNIHRGSKFKYAHGDVERRYYRDKNRQQIDRLVEEADNQTLES